MMIVTPRIVYHCIICGVDLIDTSHERLDQHANNHKFPPPAGMDYDMKPVIFTGYYPILMDKVTSDELIKGRG